MDDKEANILQRIFVGLTDTAIDGEVITIDGDQRGGEIILTHGARAFIVKVTEIPD